MTDASHQGIVARYVVSAMAALRADLVAQIDAIRSDVAALKSATDPHADQIAALGSKIDTVASEVASIEAQFVGLDDAAAPTPAPAPAPEAPAAPVN